jgi:hypothetical protein
MPWKSSYLGSRWPPRVDRRRSVAAHHALFTLATPHFCNSRTSFGRFVGAGGLGALAAGIAAIVVASAFTVYELNHRREEASNHGEETYEAAALDLKDSSPLLGPEVGPGNPVPRFLPNKKLDLAIYLPFRASPASMRAKCERLGRRW